jgi:hypothetical protein
MKNKFIKNKMKLTKYSKYLNIKYKRRKVGMLNRLNLKMIDCKSKIGQTRPTNFWAIAATSSRKNRGKIFRKLPSIAIIFLDYLFENSKALVSDNVGGLVKIVVLGTIINTFIKRESEINIDVLKKHLVYSSEEELNDMLRRFVESKLRKSFIQKIKIWKNKHSDQLEAIDTLIKNINEKVEAKGSPKSEDKDEEYASLYSLIHYEFKFLDVLKNRYKSLNARFVLTHDTTEKDNTFITMLIDLGSRLIVASVIEEEPPTDDTILRLLNIVFHDLKPNKNRRKLALENYKKISKLNRYDPDLVIKHTEGDENPLVIVHSDRANFNTSDRIVAYLLDRGIQVSLTDRYKKFTNQVSERYNATVKHKIDKYELPIKDPTLKFKDYDIDARIKIVQDCIMSINKSLIAIALPYDMELKLSSEEIHKIKLNFPYLLYDVLSRKDSTSDRLVHATWFGISYENYRLTFIINEIIPEVIKRLPPKEAADLMKIIPKPLDNKRAVQLITDINGTTKIINIDKALNVYNSEKQKHRILAGAIHLTTLFIQKSPNEITSLQLTEINNTNEIMEIEKAVNELDKTSVMDNKTAIMLSIGIANILKKSIRNVQSDVNLLKTGQAEQTLKIEANHTEILNQLVETNKKLERIINDQNEKGKLRLKKKEINRLRRKIRNEKNASEQEALYWKDYLYTHKNIIPTMHKNKEVQAVFDTIHLLLVSFGLRIANLRFITYEHLVALSQGKSINILFKKSGRIKRKTLRIGGGMTKMRKILRKNLPYLKMRADKNRDKNPDLGTDLSDLWHPSVISREHINRTISKHLKSLQTIFKKGKLSSHAYRRGVARLVATIRGLKVAQQFLNHSSPITTAAYVSTPMNAEVTEGILSDIHKFRSLDEVSVNFDSDKEKEFYQTIDQTISMEEELDNYEMKEERKRKILT